MKTSDNLKADESTALKNLLETESSGRFSRNRKWLFGVVIVIVAVALLIFTRSAEKQVGQRYKTEPAAMGNLVVKVSATGNLQPTNNVEVGSELSGIVTKVLVDDNDRVKKDQVLARLDLSKLKDAVEKSRASLAAAEAQVLQAQATMMEVRAALERLRQVSELSGGKVPSKSEMDTAEANLKRAEANEASAHASVIQARANLQSDRTNLEKASIRSPIEGVVLKRAVETGQTVAAALQTPVLFTLAEDLSKMELQVDIDEADVGQVKVGQRASFSVDAWPGRRYTGVVTRVSYGSQTKDGVVSYPTVLAVDNDDLSLRPGMTGTAEIITVTRKNVLLVPNAALRFTPSITGTAPPQSSGGLLGKLMPRPPPQMPKLQPSVNNGTPRVWVVRKGEAVAVEVETGISNGRMTEVLGGSLKVGTEVITETVSMQL